VIEPEFLAHLRQHYRAEMVLVMVQLEQVCPGWWESLSDLAAQLGTDRATLNRSLRHLEDRELIRRYSISNRSGTWIWWVKRHEADEPKSCDEPAWRLKTSNSRRTVRVPVSGRRAWAEARGIPLPTLIGFLNGRQKELRGQWQVISNPWDCEDV
jgi:DNA-binding HxlR family transcriptional regulator